MKITGSNLPTAVTAAGVQPKKQAAAQSPREKAREDKLTLSQQAKERLEEQKRIRQELEAERERMEQMKESSEAQIEATAKGLKVMLQCWKIASRIMAGDKVPPEDEKFLLDNEPKLYTMAMSARRIKDDPEEWDSVLEDEEEEDSSGDGGGSVEAVSSGEAASGGDAPAEGAESVE